MWKSDWWLPSYAPKTILGPFAPNLHIRTQFPCETKFPKKRKWQSVGHKILNKMRGYLWKSGKWLPSYAQKIILGPLAPNLYTRAQPLWGSKFLIKKKSNLFHEILNRGCMWKSDRWLLNYAPKTILGPFAPNQHTRTHSPCEARLDFQKKNWRSVGHNILNKMRGYLWKSGKWLPSYAQKNNFGPVCPNLYTGAQPPWGSKFSVKRKSSLFHEILNKMRACLWKYDRWLPSYAPKTILAHLPQIHILGPSPDVGLNF